MKRWDQVFEIRIVEYIRIRSIDDILKDGKVRIEEFKKIIVSYLEITI